MLPQAMQIVGNNINRGFLQSLHVALQLIEKGPLGSGSFLCLLAQEEFKPGELAVVDIVVKAP
jgi:hypothetical protein